MNCQAGEEDGERPQEAEVEEPEVQHRGDHCYDQLVTDAISKHCRCSQDRQDAELLAGDLGIIGEALLQENGDCGNGGGVSNIRLTCELLPGGKTNFPYRVYLVEDKDKEENQGDDDDDVDHPSLFMPTTTTPSLFAKLALPYALWSIDKSVPYDLARTENEFSVMKRFAAEWKTMMHVGAGKAGDDHGFPPPIATPYLCLDVAHSDDHGVPIDRMKLLVTEWAEGTESFSTQFVCDGDDGRSRRAAVIQLAEAFAVLNSVTHIDDPYFNDNVRSTFRSAEPQVVDIFHNLLNTSSSTASADAVDREDDCIKYGKLIGVDGFRKLIRDMDNEYMKREALVHGDAHTFNILVEKRGRSVGEKDQEEQRSPNPRVYICDWEMAMIGPVGMDVGKIQAWPLACALYHAANGKKDLAYQLIELMLEDFWDAYETALADKQQRRGDKKVDDAFLAKVYRSSLGWGVGYFFILVFYVLGIFFDDLPVQDLSGKQKGKVKGTMGYLGLLFMEYGFSNKDPDLDLNGLRKTARSILTRELDKLLIFHGDRRHPTASY